MTEKVLRYLANVWLYTAIITLLMGATLVAMSTFMQGVPWVFNEDGWIILIGFGFFMSLFIASPLTKQEQHSQYVDRWLQRTQGFTAREVQNYLHVLRELEPREVL